MSKQPRKRRSSYRVYADKEGEIYLRLQPAGIQRLITKPVTLETIDQAKDEAIALKLKQEEEEKAQRDKRTDPQRKAQRQIEGALHPATLRQWLDRAKYVLFKSIIRMATFGLSLVLLAFLYKGVQISSQSLPENAHRVVLFVYFLVLAGALYLIFTEENREKYRKYVIAYLGPLGMLILPCLLLVTAGAVLASITWRLYNHGALALDLCSGRAVSEAGLLDFYMWHFVNIIPTLQITKLWRWSEPYCYTQSRVGIMIFFFQLLVVIPSFNTIRFFWKNRKTPDYLYDPDWEPKPGK